MALRTTIYAHLAVQQLLGRAPLEEFGMDGSAGGVLKGELVRHGA